MSDWPKKHTQWIKNRTLYISIPFTWNLPEVRSEILQCSIFWDRVIIGGPAVSLIPEYFNDLDFVLIGPPSYPGVLQRVNPMATKTTMGCIRKCKFCAVPKIESVYFKNGFKQLDDWPDLPIICDNNLLAASKKHFDRVINRLLKHNIPLYKEKGHTVDFNQGLDSRLLSDHHAKRFTELKKPMIRLALDNISYKKQWLSALNKLIRAGVAKTNIRSYALIGFDSDPQEGWKRCEWIESNGIKVLPQWFHKLDALKKNIVTKEQVELGWTDNERKRLMQWYFQHNERKYGRSEFRDQK